MFLALEHMLVQRNMMFGGGVFVFGWGGGWGGVGMFPFVALARILMLRNMLSLALEHIFTATQHDVSYTRRHLYCYATWCFLHWNTSLLLRNMMSGVGLFVFGWGGGMFPFVALARILMLRNMMFLPLDHIFTATQHDVSYTRRHLYCYATWCFLHNLCFTDENKNLGVLAEFPEIFNLGTTWEHLYINGTLKRKALRWRWFFTDTQLF